MRTQTVVLERAALALGRHGVVLVVWMLLPADPTGVRFVPWGTKRGLCTHVGSHLVNPSDGAG